ncbi:hypothetical protein KEM60_01617 [Austwickia sp. TVS 96-490-7B]|uniref:threonine/serine ThrE exporter family protein n=1 Tax=Austwickia sp. TVS 96-490-7B TaxID=2830843 RepID=UPI001C589508|nr:threonine/serine exporter family protein [Austwickia sp. TVS 96-490-7B]MBW3085417.1 hypothetical protein [Austwickia sp. TVS 96-490-7B]
MTGTPLQYAAHHDHPPQHLDNAPPAGLAPQQRNLGADLQAVLRLGTMLAAAGTGSYRVTRAMHQVASLLDIDALDAAVTMTTITVTARRGGEFRTVVREITSLGVDAGRIAALERLTHRLPSGANPDDIHAALTAITSSPRRWSFSSRAAAAGVGCAAFAVLNGFGPWDAMAVIVAAGLGQYLRSLLGHHRVAPLAVVALCSATSCLLYLLLVTGAAPLVGMSHTAHDAGYVAAVLYLIPGFPLFTALLDIAHLDVVAGSIRLVYAIAVIGTSTGTVWMLSSLAGAAPLPPRPREMTPWLGILIWTVASFVAVAAFAMLFDAALRMVLLSALIGAVANLIRLGCLTLHVPAQTACFVAGLAIGLLAALISVRAHIPRITVSVPAAIIMIPGTTMYRGMYHLNAGTIDSFLTEATTATLLLIAVAAGLAVARFLTDHDWAYA